MKEKRELTVVGAEASLACDDRASVRLRGRGRRRVSRVGGKAVGGGGDVGDTGICWSPAENVWDLGEEKIENSWW